MSGVFSVDEFNNHLDPLIAQITPEPIHIRGTLTTWKRSRAWQRGELVSLTNNEIAARLSLGCTAKRGVGIAKRIAITGQSLVTPIDVTVTGNLTFHPLYGLRFELLDIDPDSLQLADTQKSRDELLADLEITGLLDRQRTLPNPTIETIGLISPRSGEAGRNDALEILTHIGLPIIEKRVLTGGAKAASGIASAIAQLEPRTDVIAIVRGGGAKSDLHVWNDETVARAVALCNTPIVVGVGHSTDQHIARRVAWHGANTPTAAAQHLKTLVAPIALPAPALPTRVLVEPQHHHAGHVTPAPIRPRRIALKLALAVLVLLVILVAYLLGLSR